MHLNRRLPIALFLFVALSSGSVRSLAQTAAGTQPAGTARAEDPVITAIVREENDHSQLQLLAHELFDSIGPRLVGSPRVRTLEGTQLAWCPDMGGKTVTAGLIILPDSAAWADRIKKTGYANKTLPLALERAGAGQIDPQGRIGLNLVN